MAFFIIPIPKEIIPFDEQVELDGTLYLMKFRYHFRDDFWRVTIIKAGVVLISAIKVINTLDLLAQYRHIEDLPKGKLIVSDQNLKDADPNSINFGDSVLMMYQDIAQ